MIVVMGSPGSGKTTLSYILQREIENSHVVSCGDLYRHNPNDKLKQAKEKGKFFWIQELQKFIIDELKIEIAKYPNKTIIIDGLWADNLKDIEQIGFIDKVYYVQCDRATAIDRLIKRGRPDDYESRIIKRVNSYFDREERTIKLISQFDCSFV